MHDLENAIAQRDFLAVCQIVIEAQGPSGSSPPLTFESIEQAARDDGEEALKAYERDRLIAPLALSSRSAIENYALATGKRVESDLDCSAHIRRNRGKKNEEYTERVCSPIIICGEGHNPRDGGACLEILVRTTKQSWNRTFVARSELTTGPTVQSRLQDAGLRVGDWKVLLHLLQNVEPQRKFARLENAGWTGMLYALPNGEVIPPNGDVIATFPPVENFGRGGSIEEANQLLAAVQGNALLQFAVCAALSAPIQAHYGYEAEPGGFHLYGSSSRGKTTAICLAASMWGRGAEKKDDGIVDSWNTTAFAAEVSASQHSDCVLVLDEVRSADPAHFASLALGLANGAGKKAGKSDGGIREAKTFRPMVLSTGEISAKDYIESNDISYHGGMSVRLIDISAEVGPLGVFEVLPAEFADDPASFARYIKQTSAAHFGHHGRALVTEFVSGADEFLSEVREAATGLRTTLATDNIDPQVGRVLERFAFIGAVAVVAVRRGILPWSIESVHASIAKIFDSWLASRGGEGSQEGLAAERAFSAFVYANPNRFDTAGTEAQFKRVGRATFTKDFRRQYWIADDAGLAEMLGNQPERIQPFLKHLIEGRSETWELEAEPGRHKKEPPRGFGLPRRCYCITAKTPEPYKTAADNDDASVVIPSRRSA